MDPTTLLFDTINPALKELQLVNKAIKPSDEARKMLLTIAQKEAGPDLEARYQSGGGPARGLLQFERIAVLDVMSRHRTRDMARSVLGERGFEYDQYPDKVNDRIVIDVHEALAKDDRLAFIFGRLNLWNDNAPLPSVTDRHGAFSCYLRVWRPGAWTDGAVWQRDKIREAWAVAWDRSERAMDAEGPMA